MHYLNTRVFKCCYFYFSLHFTFFQFLVQELNTSRKVLFKCFVDQEISSSLHSAAFSMKPISYVNRTRTQFKPPVTGNKFIAARLLKRNTIFCYTRFFLLPVLFKESYDFLLNDWEKKMTVIVYKSVKFKYRCSNARVITAWQCYMYLCKAEPVHKPQHSGLLLYC